MQRGVDKARGVGVGETPSSTAAPAGDDWGDPGGGADWWEVGREHATSCSYSAARLDLRGLRAGAQRWACVYDEALRALGGARGRQRGAHMGGRRTHRA